MTGRRADRLHWWPAALGVALTIALFALGRALAEFVDDAIAEVDYT